jgi:hypothetical protein
MRIAIYLYLIVAIGGISLNAEISQSQCSLLLQAVFVIAQVMTFCLLTTNTCLILSKKFIFKIISFLIVFVLSSFLVNFSYLSPPSGHAEGCGQVIQGWGLQRIFNLDPFS